MGRRSAGEAAGGWNGSAAISGFAGCGLGCVAAQTSSDCAVWCYEGALAGRVVASGSVVCTCPFASTATW